MVKLELRGGRFWFWCPGCETYHVFTDEWKFNGNFERPTFEPSLVSSPGTDHVCHLFLRDGQLEFLKDSYHELAGRTVALPDVL